MENREDKIRTLRLLMKQNGVDVLILPQSDPHIGEEIPDHWKIIQWLTGFSGSAATVIVTESFAGLWTDSRYFIQAEEQLAGSGFEFMRPGSLIPADYVEWLREHIIAGSRIGFDGKIFPVREFRRLKDTLKAMDVEFAADSDPVKSIWVDRPPLPSSMVWDHQLSFAGKDRAAKISMVRRAMKERNLDMHLLTSPADIMWMLNIRGSDLQFTPVSFCYALVENDGILLFIDRDKIGQDLLPDLSAHGVEILQYGEIAETLSSGKDSGSLLLSPSTLSVAVYDSVPGKINIVEDESIPSVLKAVKNRVEIENISSVMVKDGVALTRFFRWLEEGSRDADLTELELCEKLRELRSEQDDYLGPSFSTIAAYNEHSALPHYSPGAGNNSVIGECGILLVDSGGQYRGGTTDITRTVTLGSPTARQKKDFTLVLKGHIALALAKFPAGTRGYQIDILARKALWESGYNYGHGTGHGIGYCLSVHEGPQSVSPANNKTAISPGMLISNEPALYRPGEYGIRTENLILCYEDEETEFGIFLRFDTVSLCYIDQSLIDKSLLDAREIEWINSYHREVYEKLSPFLNEEERKWLEAKTIQVSIS